MRSQIVLAASLAASLCSNQPAVAPAPRPSRTAAQQAAACRPADAAGQDEPWQLIGHFSTYYPGSGADRNFNLRHAAQRLCGVVVPADGVFSFNGSLGEASRENGYRKGGVFVGDRIVPGYGGGICQVASTVYNAAIRAGLPIAVRHQHGLTVPYLTPGEDSTVAYPYLDLRVRNDTGHPLRLLVSASGPRVTAEFFGVREPPDTEFLHQFLGERSFQVIRKVDPSLRGKPPRVLRPGQKGVRVHTWLLRRWPDGRRERIDLGVDDYRPSPRIMEVGPEQS